MFSYLSNKLVKKGLFFFLFLGSTLSFGQTTYWWNDAIFYEVFVRSYKDSDGDGKGDLNGLINNLDYLNDGDPTTHNDLGITGIWLMPIQQSPSYHGYDVMDYKTVETDYGTNADFKNLIDAAHARGIKVIIDYVMNHTSSQHPWFQASAANSAKRDWYIWSPTNPNYTGPLSNNQVWYSKNGSYYYAIFWSEMPDLNYTTQAVKDTMFDIAKFWLQDMKADGFRLDAARYVIEDGSTVAGQEDTPETIAFWKDFRTAYKSYKPDAFAVGEAWTTTTDVGPYVSSDGVTPDGLDFCFEFDLASTFITAINGGTTTALKSKINQVMSTYPFLQFGTFLTNHDQVRLMSQLTGTQAAKITKAKLASDLLFTFPGVTYMYYGEEIGMSGGAAGDEYKRTPLQWDGTTKTGFTTGNPWWSINPEHSTQNINILYEQYDQNSLWNHYNKLIALRKDQVALRRGDYKAVTSSAVSVLAFLRQAGDENILVVSNLGSSAVANVQVTLASAGITAGTYKLVNLLGGNQVSVTIDGTGGFSNLALGQLAGQTTAIYKLMDPTETNSTITFQVDMNALITDGTFIPGTDFVDLVATFNDYGADSLSKLKDPEGDGIYTTTIPNLAAGSLITYKYELNGVANGTQEYANSTALRQYFVPEAKDTVTVTYEKQDLTITTGVENPLEHSILVYPIPSSHELFVEFSQDFTGKIDYQLCDLLGAEIAKSSFVSTYQAGAQSISCGKLTSGVYILKLSYNETTKIVKVIVQK